MSDGILGGVDLVTRELLAGSEIVDLSVLNDALDAVGLIIKKGISAKKMPRQANSM